MKNILYTICARGGSKGIPKKNIKNLNGRPLIDYSIKCAEIVKNSIGGIIELSSDDPEIINCSKSLGLISEYIRPDYLADDKAGKVDAINDLLKYCEIKYKIRFDFVVDLDVSSPLRTVNDVEKAINIMERNSDALTLFSVNEANKNPYFNMVEETEEGFYILSKNMDSVTLSRQTAPKVYELNASIYVYNRSFFDLGSNKVITSKSLILPMDHICFDLDHQIDFDFMEYLLKNNKLNFDLV